jgi:type I restriction enzyme S subunit
MDNFDDDGVIVLRSTEQTVGGGWKIDAPAKLKFIPPLPEDAFLKAGDIVITKSSGSSLHIGKASLVNEQIEGLRCTFSNFMQRLRCKPTYSSRLVWYFLNSVDGRAALDRSSSTTTGLANLNGTLIGNLEIIFPPLAEQHRIAAYLDEQTEKIDRLMDMRRRQMALLKEQRAALIQQTVTRGLNPNAPMKDSGLPWLGEIPAHWLCSSLRRFWGVIDCKHLTVPFLDEGYPLASVSEVQSYELDLSQAKRTSEEFWRLLIEGGRQPLPGDLIYCRNTSVGAAACVSSDEPIAMGQDVCLIRSPKQNSRYLNYVLRSGFMTEQLNTILVGATFKRINVADIKALIVLCPPKSEQDDIVEFIDSQTAKLDALHAAYARQLTLLAEYRAALIHECVTGQRSVSQRTVVEATPTKANIHFLRAVLCSEIVHRLHQEPTFGRVKLEKFLYLSEAYAGIDLEGKYQRAAAGPFDNQALRSAESQIQKQKWYQPVKGEKGTRYLPMEKAGGHQKYFSRYWPEQQPKFDRLFTLLRSFDTERCEIVATLFAVWSDRLRAERPCTDVDIVDEVLTQWHPSKQRISRDRWLSALKWMKQEGLTP